MPDNHELVKSCLGKLGLPPQREAEIQRELAEHLEDCAEASEAQGLSTSEALRKAFKSVPDWPALRREILSAEYGEENMNNRTKVLWLPAFCALAFSSGLLAILQFAGIVPRFYWLSGQSMSRYPFFTFYLGWLITLPVLGAFAAFWSRRVGGQPIQRLLAAMAPSLGMLGFLLIFPLLSLISIVLWLKPGHAHVVAFSSRVAWITYLTHLVSWVLVPAIPLLLGAVPFLRKSPTEAQ